MLTITPLKDAAKVCLYYGELLGKKAYQYYQDMTEQPGIWAGMGSAMLGLGGQVATDMFRALAFNSHPKTGEQLTPSNKSDRLVGWDLTFAVPKSVSLAYLLAGDDKVAEVVRRALQTTMRHVEESISTRVRVDGRNDRRTSGNCVWVDYRHLVGRPVEGTPDPHLHHHCVIFNATYDAVEERWKAIDFKPTWDRAAEFQTLFFTEVAHGLAKLGYNIVKTEHAFEIKELIPFVQRFSKRTEAIEKLRKERGITDPKKAAKLGPFTREAKRHDMPLSRLLKRWLKRLTPSELATLKQACEHKQKPEQAQYRDEPKPDVNAIGTAESERQRDKQAVSETPLPNRDNKAKQTMGGEQDADGHGPRKADSRKEEYRSTKEQAHKNRGRKQHESNKKEKRDTDEAGFAYRDGFGDPKYQKYKSMETTDAAREAAAAAVEDAIARDAVMSLSSLRYTAMRVGMGKVNYEEVTAAIFQHNGIECRMLGGSPHFTTHEALEEEKEFINQVREGMNAYNRLGPRLSFSRSQFNLRAWDKRLLKKIFASRGLVTLVKYPGTSRRPDFSRAAFEGFKQAGREVVVLGANAATCRMIEERYLKPGQRAETVHSFITRAELGKDGRRSNSRRKNQSRVIWVEDAGSLGMRTLFRLVLAIRKAGGRPVLLGDNKVMRAFERGNPFAIFRHYGVKTIERLLKDEEREDRDHAVDAFRRRDGKDLVWFLDSRDQLTMCQSPPDVLNQTADHMMESLKIKRSVLAIGASHQSVDSLIDVFRERLRAAGKIGKRDRMCKRLVPVSFGENDKVNFLKLEVGMVIDFRLNHEGFRSGQRTRILEVLDDGKLKVQRGIIPKTIQFNSKRMTVSTEKEIGLARGDKIRLVRNKTDKKDHRFRKHDTFDIRLVTPTHIHTTCNKALPTSWGYIEHAWASRHTQAQGLKADDVFVFGSGYDWRRLARESFQTALQAYQKGFRCVADSPGHLTACLDDLWPRTSASDLTDRMDELQRDFGIRYKGTEERQQEEQAWQEQWQQEQRDDGFRRRRMGGL